MLDTVEFEENNRILLRKVNFVLMIPNPSLDCSYVVLHFWPNLSLVVLIKLFLSKNKRVFSLRVKYKTIITTIYFNAKNSKVPD